MSARSTEAMILAHLWERPSALETGRWRRLARAHPQVVSGLLGATGACWVTQPETSSLSTEYDRRVGGTCACPGSPYESMWREDIPLPQRHGYWAPAIASLQRIYTVLSIPAPAERADEITVELNALGAALNRDDTLPLARALVDEHLARWIPGFLRALTRMTGHPFYGALAEATGRWLGAVRSELGDVPAATQA